MHSCSIRQVHAMEPWSQWFFRQPIVVVADGSLMLCAYILIVRIRFIRASQVLKTILLMNVSIDIGIVPLQLFICPCQTAPVQLLARGLFGCSPHKPGVAVDIRQLDFLSILHANTAPNLSAWCMSLQEHLGSLGYHFDTQVRTHMPYVNSVELSMTPTCLGLFGKALQ
jgi:hypothetical protein